MNEDKIMEKNTHESGVRCPECGSGDVQVESCVRVYGGGSYTEPLERGGFFCASCGYHVPKTVVSDSEREAERKLVNELEKRWNA
jgi:hypothetical protein